MANNFKSYPAKGVGTTPVSVYTTPASTQTTLIGLSVANTSASPITTDVYVTRSAVDNYLIKSGVVPVGGALVVVGGDQKVVLEAADVLKVVTSAASSADVWASLLEVT